MKKIISAISTTFIVVSLSIFCVGCGNNNYQVDYKAITQNLNYGDVTYVIGHKSPDTDTVCSAIAYANLKQKLGVNCKPAVSGNINNETKFVLQKFNVSCPEILSDATNKNIILVDHSTYTQSVNGMKSANIIEMLDHHNLGDVKSQSPLQIKTYPIGSTATIVYTSYLENNIAIDEQIAGLLLSAILSDTANLSSDTTTDVDKKAVEHLSKIAKINDLDSYNKELETALLDYTGLSDADILLIDSKEYDMSGSHIVISSVSINDNDEVTEAFAKRMQTAMSDVYNHLGVEHIYCMVNNKLNDYTLILSYGNGAQQIANTAFGQQDINGEIKLSPGVSRKKGVVPKLEAVYKK